MKTEDLILSAGERQQLSQLLLRHGYCLAESGLIQSGDGVRLTLPEQIVALQKIVASLAAVGATTATSPGSADQTAVLAAKDSEISSLKESNSRAWLAVADRNKSLEEAKTEIATREAVIKAKDEAIATLERINQSPEERHMDEVRRNEKLLSEVADGIRGNLIKRGHKNV